MIRMEHLPPGLQLFQFQHIKERRPVMKKLRFIVAFLCLWMLLGNRNVFADTFKVNLTVGTVTAGKEDSVTVPISISDNHGICGASISVTYDKALTLTGIQGGDGLSSLTMTRPGDPTANPVIILWDGVNADTSNGNIALLTFKAPETEGNYPVTVSYEDGDIVDGDLNAVELNIINGSINVAGEGEHKHNFTSTITQKPTCTEKGVKTYRSNRTWQNRNLKPCGTYLRKRRIYRRHLLQHMQRDTCSRKNDSTKRE